MNERPSFLAKLWNLPSRILESLDPEEAQGPEDGGGIGELGAIIAKRLSRKDAPIDGD
jgi:hypothetical protein